MLGLLAGSSAQVTADAIVVAGTDVLACSPEELRRMRGATMGLVFQDALSRSTRC